MARGADITCDVNTDVESRRVYRLTAGTPPPEEGEFCGLLFAGERGAEGYVPITVIEQGAADGFQLALGDIAADGDGTWDGGAVPLDDDTKVSEAIDRLNEVLGKLVPGQPPAFPNGTLSVANAAGANALLADGFANPSGLLFLPGTAVTRITAASVSTFVLDNVGPGDVGVLSASLNDAVAATHELTGSDNGTYNGLVIADQKDFPVSTPGFWKSIDVSLTGLAVPLGLNVVSIAHSGAGQTNELIFVRDDHTASPAISGGSVSEADAGTLVYSSSVPHYDFGARLTVGFTVAGLAGQTYYGGAPFTVSGPVIATQAFDYTDVGIATPMAAGDVAAKTATPQDVVINGTGHVSGKLSLGARNVNGQTSVDLGGPTILIKVGSSGARVDEMAVPVSGLGALPVASPAVRKGAGTGDTPSGAPSSWVSSAALPDHEAAVVAGVLKHDRTDYTGYLPSGPNLSSGRDGAQYATFSFRRAARSAFRIEVTGTYAGCWVKLPGVSDAQPNAPGGWWDAFAAYDGAGVPGEAGDAAAGCASGAVMDGTSGLFQITFGTESSTNADDNEILVRFRLEPGQSITALSFRN